MIDRTAAQTSEMLSLASGKKAMSRIQTFDWFLKFGSGVSMVNLSTSICEQTRWILLPNNKLVHENIQFAINDLTSNAESLISFVYEHSDDLNQKPLIFCTEWWGNTEQQCMSEPSREAAQRHIINLCDFYMFLRLKLAVGLSMYDEITFQDQLHAALADFK